MAKHVTNDELLAVVDDQNEMVESVNVSTKIEGYINTFDLQTFDGKMKAAKAFNDAESLNDRVGDEIMVCDVMTMPGVRQSRMVDQMPTQCINTFIIDDKGSAYFSQSDGIADSIAVIVGLFPDLNKENGGLKCKIVEKTTSRGNTLKRLVPVTD